MLGLWVLAQRLDVQFGNNIFHGVVTFLGAGLLDYSVQLAPTFFDRAFHSGM